MKARVVQLWLATLLAWLPFAALAHKESDAYLTLRTDPVRPNLLHGQFDIAFRDLNRVIDIDSNHDNAVTWIELKTERIAIERYALAGLEISNDGVTCQTRPVGQRTDTHNDGVYDVIFFDVLCKKRITSQLSVVYRLFQGIDPYHRAIVTLHAGERTVDVILRPGAPKVTLDLRKQGRGGQFVSFMVNGIWHIWTGPDHLLFILSLLLPAVLYRSKSAQPARSLSPPLLPTTGWLPVPRFSQAMLELLKVVSAFTVSHSVTLVLSVMGYVSVPSRVVEAGIALSIIVAALNNLYPLVTHRAWLVAFAFGFIHGLGFASALAGLSLSPAAMATSLGGFSVGVELGQEAVVLPFLPLAFLMRKTRFYQVGVLWWGSLSIIALSSWWLLRQLLHS